LEGTDGVRLFAGIFPPRDIVPMLTCLASEISELYPEGQYVKPERMHITLRFFGNEDPTIAASIISDALRGVSQFDVELKRIGAFPSLRSARVLFIEIENAKIIEEIMLRAGDVQAHAHLTLARFRSPRSIEPLEFSPICFKADEVLLVKSVLGKDSRYENVGAWRLN
jgi:2'-5' RNA ligase